MRSRVLVAVMAIGLAGSLGPIGVDAASSSGPAALHGLLRPSSAETLTPHVVTVRQLPTSADDHITVDGGTPPLASPAAVNRSPRAGATSSADIRIESTINGLDYQDGGGSSPPDVQIAVGSSAVMEMVNVAGRTWTKAGAVTSTFDLSAFFGTGSDDVSDPRVLYDAPTGRWFASLMDVKRSFVSIAVSAGDDPAGQWSLYTIPAIPNTCPDQPKLGIGNQAVVVTADFFDSACTAKEDGNVASKFWVLDKAQLMAGGPLTLQAFGPDATYSGIIAAQDLTSSDTVYVAAVDWNNAPDQLHVYEITGPPSAGMSIPTHDIPIGALAFHARGNQPGKIDLEAAVGKIDDAAFQNGVLSLAMDDECKPAGDPAKHSCARVERISTTSWKVLSEAKLGLTGQDISYPAMRPDSAGNLNVVFGYSSEKTYPSLGVITARPDGTWSDSTLVLGTGTYSVNDAGDATAAALARYGDYFGAAVDPNDPDLIWVAGEIGKKTTDGDWATVIGSVRYAGGPPLTVSTSATAIAWGTGVTFSVHLAPDSGGGTGAGRAVHLQSSVDHVTWGTISELTTDATGDATFQYRPVTNLYYRAVFDGATDYPAVTSPEKRVTVRQILLLRPDNAGRTKQIPAGSTVTFAALVRPARSDVPPGTVTVQVWEYTGSWELVASRTLRPDASGRTSLRVSFPDQASYYVRAIANPTPVNANSAWSPIQRYDAV